MACERTPKQQYLDMAKGIQPDRLLQYCYGPNPYAKFPLTTMNIGTSAFPHVKTENGSKDIWGVNYIGNKVNGGAALPEPGNYVIKDITKWRDSLKAPGLEGIDWEAVAKKDLAKLAEMGVNRNETALGMMTHLGYFQLMMSFMGFEEGLCALLEEPEECKALVDYMSDFYCAVVDKTIDLYKPDYLQVTDDLSAWGAPFIPLDIYREIFRPAYEKLISYAKDRDMLVAMHCCGNCGMFIDDWLEMGVTYWDPAQLSNDLVAIQEKYGDKLVIVGGFDMEGKLLLPTTTEEDFKAFARNTIDKYTRTGMYVLDGWLFCDPDNVELNNRNKWLTEVCEDYGLDAYKRNR